MSVPDPVDRRSLFREVNERMRAIEDTSFGGEVGVFAIFCECARLECAERVEVPEHVYAEVRSHEQRFLIALGHEQPDEERMVARDATYCIVASPREALPPAA